MRCAWGPRPHLAREAAADNAERITVAAVLLLAGVAACKPQQPAGASVSQVAMRTIPQVSYVIRSPEGPVPGLQVSRVEAAVRNPYDGVQGAIEEGRFLYVRMNCAYCHGFTGTGGMGPDLTDPHWRYGGSDADLFASIARGRAKGMPAWGGMLPENQIWKLVAYVRSLGGVTGQRYTGAAGTPDETKKQASNTTEH